MIRTFFRHPEARDFLKSKALKSLPSGSGSIGYQEALRRLRLLDGVDDTIRKRLEGHPKYPLPEDAEVKFKSVLKISDEEWRSITRREVEIPTTLVQKYLHRLRTRGLRSVIAFFPDHAQDEEQLCVPVRVIEESEWRMWTRNYDGSPASPDSIAQNAVGIAFEGWLRRSHQRVVLQGEPGEGKSTALWLHVASLCRKLEKGEREIPVPLVLQLGRLNLKQRHNPADLAIQQMLELIDLPLAELELIEVWLQQQVENERVLLIMDGLDEVNPESIQHLSIPEGYPIVVASRYHADPSLLFRQYTTVRLVPLRWCLVDEFVSRYYQGLPEGTQLAGKIRSLLRQNPQLRQLARNPLLLAVLCFLAGHNDLATIPTTRASLLHASLMALLERGDQRRGLVRKARNLWKFKIVQKIAWRFHDSIPTPFTEVELLPFLEQWLPNEESPDAFLGELLADGILVRRGAGPIRFLFRRLQELGVASEVCDILSKLPSEIAVSRLRGTGSLWGKSPFHLLNHPGWAEIWPLAGAIPSGAANVVEMAEIEWRQNDDLTRSRTALFAQVLGEYLRSGGSFPNPDLFKLLISNIVDLACDANTVHGSANRWHPIAAKLPPEPVILEIIDRFRSGQLPPSGFRRLVRCLGEIGTNDAHVVLRWILGQEDLSANLQCATIEAIGFVGTETAREDLFRILDNGTQLPESQQLACIFGLGAVGDRLSLQRIAQMLLDPHVSEEIRFGCLDQSEHLFGPEIEGSLLALCKQPSRRKGPSKLLLLLFRALARIGTPKTAETLLPFTRLNWVPAIRVALFAAIANTANAATISILEKIADDPKSSDRPFSIVALTAVRPEFALPLIEKEIGTWPMELRREVIENCRKLRVITATRILSDRLLNDPDEDVTFAAAMAVGQRAGPGTIPVLEKAVLETQSRHIYRICLLALVGEGLCDAQTLSRPEMLEEIDLADFAIREARRSEHGRANLRKHFDQTKDPTSAIALGMAIFNLWKEQGWRALLRGGWEGPGIPIDDRDQNSVSDTTIRSQQDT